MSIEYLGLSSINGPLIVLEGVQDAFYDEIVEFVVNGEERKLGRIVEVYEDKAVIQVFEGSENMSLKNTHTKLTGHPMEIALSPDILGRTFNGIGVPIDGLGDIRSDIKLDVNGKPLNPVSREYPRNYIRTGISAIDCLTTLIRGQKLPIFSGNGLPHSLRLTFFRCILLVLFRFTDCIIYIFIVFMLLIKQFTDIGKCIHVLICIKAVAFITCNCSCVQSDFCNTGIQTR